MGQEGTTGPDGFTTTGVGSAYFGLSGAAGGGYEGPHGGGRGSGGYYGGGGRGGAGRGVGGRGMEISSGYGWGVLRD